MSDPNYDMLDMEETDYKTEFNLMWRQWVDCKEERNELRAVNGRLIEALKDIKAHVEKWVLPQRTLMPKDRALICLIRDKCQSELEYINE